MNIHQNNKIAEIETLYTSMIEEQKELKRQFQEKAQGLFNNLLKDFFELNPAINLITWTQYTPFWNDGDTCEFSVHAPYFSNATGDDIDDISSYGEYDGENDDIWSENNFAYALKNRDRSYYQKAVTAVDAGGIDVASCELLEKMIQSSEFEDVMKDMFGDHVSVQITRENGISVNGYDHD